MEINVNGNATINNYSVNKDVGTIGAVIEKECKETGEINGVGINPEEVTAPTKFAERLIDKNATLNELLMALADNLDAQNAALNEFAYKEDEEKEKELRDKFGEDYDLVFENTPELQKQKRRPGAIQLRLNCVCVALAEGAGSGVCEVYSNGYAVYDNGNRRTVIWVPDCSSATYYFGKLSDKEKEYLKEKEVIGADIMGDCPWCTALIIAGENCIESNMRHPKSQGTTSDYNKEDLDIKPAAHWVGSSHFDNPEAAYLKKEAMMEVRKGMKQLTPKQREAIQLCYYEGYTQEEAAQKLGLAQSTISGRIEYGERALSNGLKKYFKNF